MEVAVGVLGGDVDDVGSLPQYCIYRYWPRLGKINSTCTNADRWQRIPGKCKENAIVQDRNEHLLGKK